MSVRVKICGITSLEDAMAAVEAGADALGFLFYERSPRFIPARQVRDIISRLPLFVSRVGVFVNPSETLVRKAIACGVDTLQFHGAESPAFCRRFELKPIKAFRLEDRKSLEPCANYPGICWLLDSYSPDQPGGTGNPFNWDLAVEARQSNPLVILAGGLNPANVTEAVDTVRPYAVDVSSGVESAPGKKDPGLVREFITAAKLASLGW